MKYLALLILVSCVTNEPCPPPPKVPKEVNQAYLLGCFSIINYIAFSGEFTEEQYELSLQYYNEHCAPYEEL